MDAPLRPCAKYAAEEKLDKIKKYFNKRPDLGARRVRGRARLQPRHADINITLPNGIVINAKEVTEDMYSLDRPRGGAHVERQVRKWKKRRSATTSRTAVRAYGVGPRDRRHSGRGDRASAAAAAGRGIPRGGKPNGPRGQGANAGCVAGLPPHSARRQYRPTDLQRAVPMKVEDAVMQLNLLGDEVIVFTDAGDEDHLDSLSQAQGHGNYGPHRGRTGREATTGRSGKGRWCLRQGAFLRPHFVIGTARR